MKKALLLLFWGVMLSNVAIAQDEEDEPFAQFANAKIPASMQNFSFFEHYGSFLGRQLEHRLDTLSPLVTQVTFKRNYKDIDVVKISFTATAEGLYYTAKSFAITISFKTTVQRDIYLKTLGKATTANRWDFIMAGEKCKGVQVYKEGAKAIRIITFNSCGAK